MTPLFRSRGLALTLAGTMVPLLLVFASASVSYSASSSSSESSPLLSSADQARVTQLYQKGNRFLDAKRYAEAERAFLDALKIAPEIPAIHHGLGLVYIQTQDYELAVLHLEEALRRQPDQVKTIYSLARAYASVGENTRAEETYRRALQIDPKFGPAYQELAGIYYREKKWDEALASLEKAKALNPKSAHTVMLMGVTGIHAGRPDLALDAVTELRQMGRPDQARRLEYLIYSDKNPSQST